MRLHQGALDRFGCRVSSIFGRAVGLYRGYIGVTLIGIFWGLYRGCIRDYRSAAWFDSFGGSLAYGPGDWTLYTPSDEGCKVGKALHVSHIASLS